MSLKKHKIIMLTSKDLVKKGTILKVNEEALLAINNNPDFEKDRHLFFDKFTAQHLYILSDEKIEGKGFRVDLERNSIGIIDDDSYYNKFPKQFKKVVASTDTSLGLPQLPKSFIDKYIKAYNNGTLIQDVLVEYEEDYSKVSEEDGSLWRTNIDYKLKVDKNNYITIKELKDSWNREEITELIGNYVKMPTGMNQQLDRDNLLNWIEENL